MNRRSPFFRIAALVMAGLSGFLAIIFSPLILSRLNRLDRGHWETLSNVGQAYGGISAILTALALIGVVASLFLQRHQAEIARTQAIRAFQLQMLALCLDRPETYYPLMGHEVFGTAEDVRRQIFGTYFLNYVHAGYSVGFFEDKYLAADVFPRFFKFDTGREYWEAMRPVWVARYITKRSRKFVAMLDASYGQAVLAGPPVIAGAPTATAVEAKKGSSRPASVLLAGGLVAGALIGGWLARRNT